MTDSNETPFVRLPVREMRDETKPQCTMCGDMGGPEYWAYCKAATCEMRDEPAPQRAAQDGELPPLPEPKAWMDDEGRVVSFNLAKRYPEHRIGYNTPLYTADQMRLALAAAGGGVPKANSIQRRAASLHSKTGISWDEAEQLALSEAGIDDEAIDELIGECGYSGLESLLTTPDELRRFTRSVLVHQPLASSPQPEAAPADDVLEALELSPETFRTEGGVINKGKLRAAIRHPYNYLPPDHWMQARFSKPGGRPLSEAAPAVAQMSLADAARHFPNGPFGQQRIAAPEAPAQAEPSAGEVERGDVVAFEFYNRATGHAIVDYSVNTHVGNLSADKGYEARPLVYADKREEVTDGSKPIPLWQAREALDELEAAARGDAPFNHQAAAIVRAAIALADSLEGGE